MPRAGVLRCGSVPHALHGPATAGGVVATAVVCMLVPFRRLHRIMLRRQEAPITVGGRGFLGVALLRCVRLVILAVREYQERVTHGSFRAAGGIVQDSSAGNCRC